MAYEELTGRLLSLRVFNPSPGNLSSVVTVCFDEEYIYVNWLDGTKTKTKLDKMQIEYDKEQEVGVTLWFDGHSLFLGKANTAVI